MVEKTLRASAGRLMLAVIILGGAAIVPWPQKPAFSQDIAGSADRKATKPEAATDAEKQAKSDLPASDATWLHAQDMSGSSTKSERAVELALAWLAEHQLAVGGWSFDHRLGSCQGRCSSPGVAMAKAVNGATGMALLPFIDHGNTHQAGLYRRNVAAGLQFLIAQDEQGRISLGVRRHDVLARLGAVGSVRGLAG